MLKGIGVTVLTQVYPQPLRGKSLAVDDEDRQVAKVPVTIGVIIGAFLLVVAVVAVLIWAL